jgi:hypothetical protein
MKHETGIKFSFKTTALSKKCSIFAALFLMKDEYQRVHQPERRIYILSGSKGEIPFDELVKYMI